MLDAPATENLCRRLSKLGRNLDDSGVLKSLAITQRAIRLKLTPDRLEEGDGLLAVEERVDFNLVDGWHYSDPRVNELLVVFLGVVGHADAADKPSFVRLLELLVRLYMLSGHGPVNAVEVEVARAEVRERLRKLRLYSLGPGMDRAGPYLGGEVQLSTRHARTRDPLAHGLFVCVELSAVDEAVAEPDGRLDALSGVGGISG
mmetsp:Transcript_23155/g.70938  ORF Transcript_23155/g.70938 Transcript_23155/m.70938 type:complete len:203 (+) Transcript_23155:724-1332(+)